MSDWQSVLQEIDDDYLIGISNKGIVKRAYKDMETIPCEISQKTVFEENEVKVHVGEETVQIKLPLGESTCSCPSRSICRHVVQGILALKAAVVNENQSSKPISKEIVAEEQVGSESASKRKIESTNKENMQELANCTSEEFEKSTDHDQSSSSTMIQKVTQQIADYPVEKLCKALGTRKLEEFVRCAKANRKPQITYSSVAIVQPLAKSMSVKLLFPLEYSTCTCHKKDFCVHKAEAVLWCKLDLGQLQIDDLEQTKGADTEYNMEQVQDVTLEMQRFLEELLDTGLSRTSQDALDHMERMAIICHNAKLPNFENDWRRLQDSYQKYMKRVASLGIQTLMHQLTKLNRQTMLLKQAQNAFAVSKLAGAFRAEYMSALELDLIGIATEHFISKSGYEGDTVYFLEQNTKTWYTFTQARPIFYDNDANVTYYTPQYHSQESPWGLTVPFRNFAFSYIHLVDAKCDNRGRLSSSKETKGQLTGERTGENMLTTGMLGKWYYKDFVQIFQDFFNADKHIDTVMTSDTSVYNNSDTDNSYLTESPQMKLVFLKPASCDSAVFLETEQKLSMNLYDERGKMVVIELIYSKNEAEGIRYLEKITNDNLPYFFGKIYLRDGRIRMYPITVFKKNELREI